MTSIASEATGERPGRPCIWYMGAKSRVLPEFLDKVLVDEVPEGGTVADLMSGSGVVAAFCAGRWRVFANDAQKYAQVIAESLIVHGPSKKQQLLASIDMRRDLRRSFDENYEALAGVFAPELAREAELLERAAEDGAGERWCREYRRYLQASGADGELAGSPRPSVGALLSSTSMAAYRRDPTRSPACLVTAYHGNIYFGLKQAIAIDSIRSAIERLPTSGNIAGARRAHYLSALLHAASHSTSGTSHFAQPRRLTRDSQLRAMARRRRVDVWDRCESFSRSILAAVRETRHRPGNQAWSGDYRRFIKVGEERAVLRFPGPVDLVYLDPPYTADNYSRFYHVLEVIVGYDYPPLERDARGRVVRGRYPAIAQRFQSDFCRRATVEEEFRRVIHATAAAGAKLVVSYASPTGLLLKEYARRFPGTDPVKRLEALCRQAYGSVETRRRGLMHSGQGDSNLHIEELLVICRRPKG